MINTNTPLVSIVIPTRNNLQHLVPCLKSLFSQSFDDFEIVVIDNYSNKDISSKIKKDFPKVHVIRLDYNAFFCKAVNEGIAFSKGAFIALVNDDTKFHPLWLENAMSVFDADLNIGSVASKILSLRDKKRIDSAGDHLLPDGRAGNRGWGNLDRGQFDQVEEVFSACAAGAVYRKHSLQEVGNFDARFVAYYDDIDVGFRLQLQGYKCVYNPAAIMYHYGSSSQNNIKRSLKLVERNMVLNLIKNMPSELILKYKWIILSNLLLPIKLSGWNESQLKFTKRDFLAWLMGKSSTIPHMSHYLNQRKLIQANRRVSISYIDTMLNSSSLEYFHL